MQHLYRSTLGLAVLLGLAALVLAGQAQAQQVIAAGNGQTQSMDCDGGDGVVRGNDNQIAFTGACRSLLVEGNSNQLRAALAGNAPVIVRGNDNSVTYTTASGVEASVQEAGIGNRVRSTNSGAVPAPRRNDAAESADDSIALALREENTSRTIDCAGRAVLVEGNGDDYTLRGGCAALTVRGEGLRIRAEMQPGSRISLQGNGDTVAWSLSADGPDPAISVNGEGSRVSRAGQAIRSILPDSPTPLPPPVPVMPENNPTETVPLAPLAAVIAPPPAPSRPPPAVFVPHAAQSNGSLLVKGNHEARDLDCTGRDVTVEGDFELIVLRGGCRSITVRGDSNKIQAEILPNARIAINGAVNALAYVVVGGAADAVVTIDGQNDHARRIPALGAS